MNIFPFLHQVVVMVVVVVVAVLAGEALGIWESFPASTAWHGSGQVSGWCLPSPALLSLVAGKALCV